MDTFGMNMKNACLASSVCIERSGSQDMKYVIVTGMSGAGRTSALKILEDGGFYSIDNLPLSMVSEFIARTMKPGFGWDSVAIGVDPRNDFSLISDLKAWMDDWQVDYKMLFLDAGDECLLRRYKETRRAHPLAPTGRLEEGIRKEREILEPIRSCSDYIIDTTNLLIRDLREELGRIFLEGEGFENLIVTIMSFGFKHGVPADLDLLFDVRFLPNPYYVPELRNHTGNDEEVRNFVMNSEISEMFLIKLVDLVTFLIPQYIREGKNQLVIGIGCTGGQHRSVTVANELYDHIGQGKYGVKLIHRDIR